MHALDFGIRVGKSRARAGVKKIFSTDSSTRGGNPEEFGTRF
jgi:hypothetical protein